MHYIIYVICRLKEKGSGVTFDGPRFYIYALGLELSLGFRVDGRNESSNVIAGHLNGNKD